MRPRPILLTGTQRSGSSWVATVLNSAPEVALLDEPFGTKKGTPWCPVAFPYFFTYVTEETDVSLRSAVADTLRFKYDVRFALAQGKGKRDVLGMYWKGMRLRHRGMRPLIKDPRGMLMVPWMARTFGAQIVILVRHPAAYVSSRLRLGWNSHPFEQFLAQPQLMQDYLEPFRAELERLAAEPHDPITQISTLWKLNYYMVATYRENYPDWIYVRYEDLCLEPRQHFRDLFETLDLSFTVESERVVDEHSSRHNPAEVSVEQWKTLYRDSRSSVNNWKHRLTEADVRKIYEIVEPVAALFYAQEEW